MPITAEFEFDQAEHRQALHEAWSLHPLARLATPIGIAWAATGLWFGVVRSWGETSPGEALLDALPWLLLGAFIIGLAPLLQRVQARRALEEDPSLNGTQLRTVDDAGLRVVGAGYAPSLPWMELVRVAETAHFFLFFQDARLMHYIPKRVLGDVQRDELRNLIQAHAPEIGRPALAAPKA